MSKAKKYRVWFEQVNQTYFDVIGETEECAISKARKEWRSDNGNPDVSDIVAMQLEEKP